MLSLEDLTPTVARENNGLGDESPRTIVLGLLKEAQEPMTGKDLRFALNERIQGRRPNEKLVSERTVQRWLAGWLTTGLVEVAGARQAGSKGGRPEPLYQCVSLLYEAEDVVNSSPFFQTPSAAKDSVNDTDLSLTSVSSTPALYEEEVSDENRETPPPEDEVTNDPPEEAETYNAGVSDTQATPEPVSLTPEDESQVGQGVSEITDRVNDTPTLIKRGPENREPFSAPEAAPKGHPMPVATPEDPLGLWKALWVGDPWSLDLFD